MAFDSEFGERPRKTLDDIRRELDAEYGQIDGAAESVLATGEPGRARGVARTESRTQGLFRHRHDDVEDEKRDVQFAEFRQIADRHEFAMERRAPVARRAPRRSGYLLAGLVGCVAGQILLLAILTVMRYGGSFEVLGTRVAADDLPRSSQSDRQSDPPEAEAPSPSSEALAAPAVPEATAAQPSSDLPAGTPGPPSQPPLASPSPEPAIVSAATVREKRPPRVVGEPGPPSPGSSIAGSGNRADSLVRLRSALEAWRRKSTQGDIHLEPPEPTIVLGPDGRSAKIYVSMVSPIGLIPREQRWTLGPRGWNLVEDRQAGLPIASPGTSRQK